MAADAGDPEARASRKDEGQRGRPRHFGGCRGHEVCSVMCRGGIFKFWHLRPLFTIIKCLLLLPSRAQTLASTRFHSDEAVMESTH